MSAARWSCTMSRNPLGSTTRTGCDGAPGVAAAAMAGDWLAPGGVVWTAAEHPTARRARTSAIALPLTSIARTANRRGGAWRSPCLFDLARSPQSAPGLRPRVLTVLQDLDAVDEHVLHADRILVWLLEGGPIRDGRGVEHDDVREHAVPEQPAPVEPEVGRGQPAQPPHRVLQRDDLLLAHVLAQEPREVAVGARMGRREQK